VALDAEGGVSIPFRASVVGVDMLRSMHRDSAEIHMRLSISGMDYTEQVARLMKYLAEAVDKEFEFDVSEMSIEKIGSRYQLMPTEPKIEATSPEVGSW
jgi:hypothetical protein